MVESWSWTGPVGETAEFNAVEKQRYIIESSNPSEYALPDIGGPWEFDFNVLDDSNVAEVLVGVRINHEWPGDLRMRLFHPDGSNVLLAERNGWGSARLGQEVWGEGSRNCDGDLAYFSDTADQLISERAAPFSGFSKPLDQLALFEDKPANGVWKFQIEDLFEFDQGELFCIELLLTTTNMQGALTVATDVDLTLGEISWDIGDPLTNLGIYSMSVDNTSLGTFRSNCH